MADINKGVVSGEDVTIRVASHVALHGNSNTERTGIGTLSPARTLHVKSGDTVVARFESTTAASPGIDIVGSGGSGTLGYNSATGQFTFETDLEATDSKLAVDVLSIPDGGASAARIEIGTGADLKVYHDGTDAYVRNGSGVLFLQAGATSAFVIDASGRSVIASSVVGSAAVEIFIDSEQGSDSNPGTFESPIRTMVALSNMLHSGVQTVAIKRGSSFSSPLTLDVDFPSTRPLRVTPYGIGEAPTFQGSSSHSGSWAATTGDERKITANAATVGLGANIPAYWVDSDGAVTRLNRGTAGSLLINEWDLSSGEVHVNIGGDVTGTVEVPVAVTCVVEGDNVVVEGMRFRFSSNDGISVSGAPSNITIVGCVCEWNSNDGINCFTGGTNIQILQNVLSDNGRDSDGAGDGFSGHVDTEGVIIGNTIERNAKMGIANSSQGTWTVAWNRLDGNRQGIVIYPESGVAGSHDIFRNILRDVYAVDYGATPLYAMILDAGPSGGVINATNNVMVRGSNPAASQVPRGVRIPQGAVNYKNNSVSGGYQIDIVVAGSPTIDETNNNFFGATVSTSSGITLDASDIAVDPQFVDPGNWDFATESGSGLRDAGVAVSGVTRGTFGASPDIGAIESA